MSWIWKDWSRAAPAARRIFVMFASRVARTDLSWVSAALCAAAAACCAAIMA
jgi:hypothetical protein